MLRIAAAEDLTALTRLRRAATGESTEDAVGWLQQVAGLENVLLLEKPGAPPALMLAAVPVQYAHRKGIWFTGLAADRSIPADKLLPKLLEGALRAFAEKGCDFAVMTPDTAADAARLGALGFKNLLPLRVVSKPIRRNLLAQAQFDSLTVRHLMERRLRSRGTEDEETIQRRLKRAETEIANSVNYDEHVVNVEVDSCAESIYSIIQFKLKHGAAE